jgi:L-gulonolactone oxidase
MQSGASVLGLLRALNEHGLTLPTTGSIGEQTVGGVLGTGTHGTGTQCSIMSANVVTLTLLTADGRLLPCSEDSNPELFSACLVNLGCLGIVTELTLKAVDAFDLTVEEEVRDFSHVVKHLESIVESTPYPRLHWCPHADKVVIHRMHEPDGTSAEERAAEAMRSSFAAFLFGSGVASVRPAFQRAMKATNFFVMHGVYQVLLFLALYIHSLTPLINTLFHTWLHPWSTRASTAPAHEQFMFDCGISQHVTEWAIPRSNAVDALMSLHRMIRTHHLQCDFPVEVRFVRGDDILLSPAYGRDSCYINIISYRPYGRDHPMQHTFFHLFEEMMTALGGRPHWAKPFNAGREELGRMYRERLDRFENIRRTLDPDQMFVNRWLERILKL